MADFSGILADMKVAAQNRTAAGPSPSDDVVSPLDFAQSLFENTRQFMTGMPVSQRTEAFDSKHSTAGLLIDLGAAVVPYAAGAKALKYVAPELNAAIDAIDSKGVRPFLGGAAREVARMAPVEVARNVANLAVGDDDPVDRLIDSTTNLALGGALGGVVGKLATAGKINPRLSDVLPEIPETASMQDKYLKLSEKLSKGEFSGESKSVAENALSNLSLVIRDESPISGKYISELDNNGATRDVNRLFQWGSGWKNAEESGKTFVAQSRTLKAGFGGFENDMHLSDFVSRAKLPEGWESNFQYARAKTFSNQKAAKQFESVLKSKLAPIGDNTFVVQEKNGLNVIAKKVKGAVGQFDSSDQWFMAKTDDAGLEMLNPKAKAWKRAIASRLAFAGTDDSQPIGVGIYDNARAFMQRYPIAKIEAAVAGSKTIQEATAKAIEAAGLSGAESNAAVDSAKNFIRAHVAPTMFQFRGRPRAAWIRALAKQTFDDAHGMASAWMYGIGQLDESKSLFANIVSKPLPKTGISIKALIDKLDDKGLMQVWNASARGMDLGEVLEAYKKGEIGEDALNLLKTLTQYDGYITQQMGNLGSALKVGTYTPRKGHYGITRTWFGDFQVPIYNEGRQLVYLASNARRDKALEVADDMIAQAKAAGKKLFKGDVQINDRVDLATWNANGLVNKLKIGTPDFEFANQAYVNAYNKAKKPAFFNKRQGVGGYAGETAPWTKEELHDILKTHITQQHKFLAEHSVMDLASRELGKLRADDPGTWSEVTQRINDMAGRPGPLSQVQNALADKLLAPVLGKNSATKIVSTANNAMMHLQLGMGNVAFGVLNALTFMQTTMPEMVYVLSTNPKNLQRSYNFALNPEFYDTWIAGNSAGKPIGTMSALSVPKMLMRSLQKMGKPDAVMWDNIQRGMREGVLDPRLVEEYVGEGAATVQNFKEALQSVEGFSKFIVKLSEFIPAATEKFSRMQAFVLADDIGRNVIGLKDDVLYQFAKQFTENTMYLYSPADRARIITGPMGSLFGLFKNWQMHYIAGMLGYVGEGARHGNWAPLLTQIGGTTMVGGLAATPLYTAANGLSNFFTDKSLMNHIYDHFGPSSQGLLGGDTPSFSDAIYLGVPSFLGVSLSGQSQQPGADPARDAAQLFSLVHMDRMKAIGTALGNSLDNYFATGENPVRNSVVRDNLVRALAPKTFYRAVQSAESDVLRSLTSDNVQIENVGLLHKAMFMMGFNPNELEMGYKVSEQLWNDQNAKKSATAAFGKAWLEAMENDDSDEMERLQVRAMAQGLDVSSIARSAQQRMIKKNQDMFDRNFKPEAVGNFENALGGR